MKTEGDAAPTPVNVWTASDDLPHLTHEEYLPIIGSCQVSSILSNLEVPDKLLHHNVDIPTNMELIVLQNANYKLTDPSEQNALANDYVILKSNESVDLDTVKIQPEEAVKSKKNEHKKKLSLLFLFCDLCPFLSTNDADMSTHIENAHKNGTAVKSNPLKCPGCANIFYHRISLRSHLTYDHGVGSPELLRMVQSVVANSKKRSSSKPALDCKDSLNIEDCEVNLKDEIDLKSNDIFGVVEQPEAHLRNGPIKVLNLTDTEPKKDIPFILNLPTVDISRNSAAKIFNNYIKKTGTISKYMDDKKTHKCVVPSCKVRLSDEEKMSYHIKCHVESSFQCPECHASFFFWKMLTGHLWRLHKVDMELFSCDKCDYKTFSLAKLNNVHKLIHSDTKAFICEECKKAFKNSKQLRNHKTTHKQKSEDSHYSCESCKKSFYDKRQLKIHEDGVHKKIKPFLCSFCGYKGATRGALKVHIRQHTGEKPFACDSCNFTTSDHNSLRRHKLRHSGQRPYKCSHCDYACIQSSTYKVHLKTKHPGLEKDLLFSCNECSFRTINKDIYASHLSTAHKE